MKLKKEKDKSIFASALWSFSHPEKKGQIEFFRYGPNHEWTFFGSQEESCDEWLYPQDAWMIYGSSDSFWEDWIVDKNIHRTMFNTLQEARECVQAHLKDDGLI